MEKKKIINIWNSHIESKPQKDFDTYYESIEIVDKVTKTGEGKHDFVITKEVIVTKTPIKEVIAADAESVGVYNIIKQVMRTGDTSLLPADTGNCKVDLVGAPENLMELKQMGVDAEKAFNGLPADLKGDMDMQKFVDNMSQEKFDAFIKAMTERASGKKEEVNE